MGRKTKIDWCDSSWNPITGCLHGCAYCYADRMARRFGCHMKPETDFPVLDYPIRNTDTYAYMRVAGISAGTASDAAIVNHVHWYFLLIVSPIRDINMFNFNI